MYDADWSRCTHKRQKGEIFLLGDYKSSRKARIWLVPDGFVRWVGEVAAIEDKNERFFYAGRLEISMEGGFWRGLEGRREKREKPRILV